MFRLTLFLLGLLLSGCTTDLMSIRLSNVTTLNYTPQTRNKYHIVAIHQGNLNLDGVSLGGSREFTRSEIRAYERACPGVFSAEGIPIEISISRRSESENLPGVVTLIWGMSCACTLGIIPIRQKWEDVNTYQIKLSTSSITCGFVENCKHDGWMSTLGLCHLMPMSPLAGSCWSGSQKELFNAGCPGRNAVAYGIAAALCEYERREGPIKQRTRIGIEIGD